MVGGLGPRDVDPESANLCLDRTSGVCIVGERGRPLPTTLRHRVLLIALLGAPGLTSCAGGPSKTPEPVRPAPQWCVAPSATVDSALAVAQALHMLWSPSSDSLKRHSIRHVDEGFLVSLVPARLIAGGGGLVWVDGETGCPIVLIRYE